MMDIEKLIHCLQCCARVDAHNGGCDDCGLEYCGPECQQLCGTAATALFTLQAENEKLRAELEQKEKYEEGRESMREILFRGFHPCEGPDTIVVGGEKVNGRWAEGYFYMVLDQCFIMHGPANDSNGSVEVLPSTVGQYINVDCFGTKVFEHDVIAVEDEQGEIYRFCVAFGECGGTKNVKHKVGYMGFHFEARDEETKVCMKYGARDDILYWLNAYNCEVIGTVFDEEAPNET